LAVLRIYLKARVSHLEFRDTDQINSRRRLSVEPYGVKAPDKGALKLKSGCACGAASGC
jgi:hypothetical protein